MVRIVEDEGDERFSFGEDGDGVEGLRWEGGEGSGGGGRASGGVGWFVSGRMDFRSCFGLRISLRVSCRGFASA